MLRSWLHYNINLLSLYWTLILKSTSSAETKGPAHLDRNCKPCFHRTAPTDELAQHTAISRKVVGKNVHATIPKGNMGYVQYMVPDTVAVEPTFVAFLYHSQTYVYGLSCHSMKFLWKTVNSKPPTIPFGVVTCTLYDNLSRNSCI